MFNLIKAGQRSVVLCSLGATLLLSGCAALGSYPVRLDVDNAPNAYTQVCEEGLQLKVSRGSEVILESPRVEAGERWSDITSETFSPGEASVEAYCYQESQTGVFKGTAYLGYNKSSIGMYLGVSPNDPNYERCLYNDPSSTSEMIEPAPCVS